ncbi:MAG: hypothetical protein ACHQVK_03440, partial [Candidatus Paceibacterales bacterium]
MGYYLQGFICKTSDSNCLTNAFDRAIKVDIGQGLSLLPMTEDLFDQINNFSISNDIDSFQYLTENIETKILLTIGDRPFSYVEAEYHGGQGGQIAIIWKEGKRLHLLPYDQDRINQVLKYFGAVAD